MQYKIRRYCPRCKTWVSRNTAEWCGLHKCFCGRKFHSLDVLTKHLSLIHFYDYQQISQFLYKNPKSKNGIMKTKSKVDWLNNVFCVSCSNYLTNETDQSRFCRSIKCIEFTHCSFIAHSKDHLQQHLTEVHAKMPFQQANAKFFNQWCETIWSKKQYFLCHLCNGFITYPDGGKDDKVKCGGYKCPIASCESNTKHRPYHDIDHLLSHMKQCHRYWKCDICSKFLPPNVNEKCQQIFCQHCNLFHHNNGDADECKITLNITDMGSV